MSREAFMKELEYLIQDIPDEEKADALQYYYDYLDEAGPEREEEVLLEYGSPERIASMIRSDVEGSLKDGGEFTDKGYVDERFKDPNYRVANRYDLPDVTVESKNNYDRIEKNRQLQTNRTLRICLCIVLILLASPMLAGIGGGVIGILSGLFGVLVALIVVIGVLTGTFLLVGLFVLIAGLVHLFVVPVEGVLLVGIGLLCLGLGSLCLVVAILFYGRFLPFLFRSILNGANRLLHGRRRKQG